MQPHSITLEDSSLTKSRELHTKHIPHATYCTAFKQTNYFYPHINYLFEIILNNFYFSTAKNQLISKNKVKW